MSKARIAGGVLAALVTVVGGFEGVRYVAHRDPVGIPTICFGHTLGVEMGDTATPAQCDTLLADELAQHAEVLRCFSFTLEPHQQVAVISWTYNVGIGAACKSTLVRLANAGHPPNVWCAQLSRWTRAGGIELPGLVRRRAEERSICEGSWTSTG
ncbi:MAG: lysozyme [Sinimarinibacterium flocculans]|uniref:lysozyme n=1 Tax=Sinimarinibacterium flocculans TaxID=985250 RepID=UPI003C52ECB6